MRTDRDSSTGCGRRRRCADVAWAAEACAMTSCGERGGVRPWPSPRRRQRAVGERPRRRRRRRGAEVGGRAVGDAGSSSQRPPPRPPPIGGGLRRSGAAALAFARRSSRAPSSRARRAAAAPPSVHWSSRRACSPLTLAALGGEAARRLSRLAGAAERARLTACSAS